MCRKDQLTSEAAEEVVSSISLGLDITRGPHASTASNGLALTTRVNLDL